jgi:hypothetical protein
MHGMEHTEFINAQQAKSTYKYKNTKEKLLKRTLLSGSIKYVENTT